MSADDREVVEYARDDEAVRDGIGEEDNAIPGWFNAGFYGLILVGVVYLSYYTLSGWSAAGQYAAEVETATAAADAVKSAMPAQNPYRGDPAAIAEGAEVFATICVACHQADASGLVGPSLVDPYWKYGNTDAERYETVANGRPGGMPPWAAQLGSEKIWKVLAYTETLPQSDVPGVGSPDFAPTGP